MKLNPVSALLSRHHMDSSLERALEQTITSPNFSVQPEVPVSLLPEIMPSLLDTLNQHGAILQLPPKPHFTDTPQVAANHITLQWEVEEQSADVSSDRTLTYSLHCYGDIPYKTETKITFSKRLRRLVTPESGFEDMSEASESKTTFPSLPSSLVGSRNISSVLPQDQEVVEHSSRRSGGDRITEEPDNQDSVLPRSNLPSLLPDPIRLPKRKLNVSLGGGGDALRLQASASGGVLNLPPLIGLSKQQQDQPLQLLSLQSMATTSGMLEGSEEGGNSHMSTVDESEQSDHHKASQEPGEEASSTSLSELSDEMNEYTDLGRFCQGYAFEEIYCGEETSFQYSGLVAGASYYFRVRCHNAAGWGPWSDTIKCMTTIH